MRAGIYARLMVLGLATGFLLAACGPDYGEMGSRQFRGDGFGNVGFSRGSYGYDGPG